MTRDINDYTIKGDANVLDALAKLNTNPTYTLFVIDEHGRMVGSLTDGDIRRGLLQGFPLDSFIINFCHKQFRFLDTK